MILGKESYKNSEKQKVRLHWKNMCQNVLNNSKTEVLQHLNKMSFEDWDEFLNNLKRTNQLEYKYAVEYCDYDHKESYEDVKYECECRSYIGDYICMPSKECIEIENVVKPLGIELDKVKCIERDKNTADLIKNKYPKCQVFNMSMENFLGDFGNDVIKEETTDEFPVVRHHPFSMINLDFCDKVSENFLANMRAFESFTFNCQENYSVAITILGRREDEEGKKLEALACVILVALMKKGIVNEKHIKRILNSGRELRAFTTLCVMRGNMINSSFGDIMPINVQKWCYYNETSPMITVMSEWDTVHSEYSWDSLFFNRIAVPEVKTITPFVKKDRLTLNLKNAINNAIEFLESNLQEKKQHTNIRIQTKHIKDRFWKKFYPNKDECGMLYWLNGVITSDELPDIQKWLFDYLKYNTISN